VGVTAASIEFLPVGDDSRAWSFAAVAGDGTRWFLKIRRGEVDPATVLVPMSLRDHGLEQVVAAVPAHRRQPVAAAGRLHAAGLPVGRRRPGDGAGLSDRQWAALGRFVAAARPKLVLCHADIHLANLLVAGEDRLAVVDTARRVDPYLAVS
jgi:spectinomycin phosphotransferase